MHGCFWHAHGCKCAHVPKSNVDYWKPKLERNQARDGKNMASLAAIGWESLIVWECETVDAHSLTKRLRTFLGEKELLSIGVEKHQAAFSSGTWLTGTPLTYLAPW